jgi:hypothetical protein
MDPEESAVTSVRHTTSHGLAGVLPQILADHGLGNSLDHAGIGVRPKAMRIKATLLVHVEPRVNLGCE